MPSSRRTPTTRLDPRGPLVFDTRTLPRRPGSVRTENRNAPAPADLQTGMAGVQEGANLELDVTLESVTEGVLVTATVTAPVTGECARCLEPVAQTMQVWCRELFSYEQGSGSYEQAGGDAAEDGYSLDGDLLDLEPVLRDALVPALPLAPLCRDDCPGLCAECGVLLAQAGPEHGHERAVDPRWAGLQQRMTTQAEPAGSPGPEKREESGRGRP
ncbi:MAG TPA: metal-binding protein [Actinobacteria bacterium]|nr:metal-binding protein [Actinomycetota bacterium]